MRYQSGLDRIPRAVRLGGLALTTIAAVTRIGAITVRVPSAASYMVIANASLGQATVRIPQNPSAPHTIRATTDVGAILVTYLGAPG